MKSNLCSKILQLMDKDHRYQSALSLILKHENLTDAERRALEKELETYI